MKRRTVGFLCSAVFALMAVSSHAVAQQKTVRACQEEWRANKAAIQANGITERAYVAQCRGGGLTVAPAPSTGPTQMPTSQKTVRACREEWRANKAANQANGVTERAYVAQCRGGGNCRRAYDGSGSTRCATNCTYFYDSTHCSSDCT
jgi:hypothetical protein